MTLLIPRCKSQELNSPLVRFPISLSSSCFQAELKYMCLRFSFPTANEFTDQFCLKTLLRNPFKHNEALLALGLLSRNTGAVSRSISTLTLLRGTHPGKGEQITFPMEIKWDFPNTTQLLTALQERLKKTWDTAPWSTAGSC